MATEATIAAIVAMQKRAEEYSSSTKCRYAAGAEKIQEAVVLVQRLPGLSEDNLVALYLQADRCRYLTAQAARTDSLSGAHKLPAHESLEFLDAASALLLLATAALFRRMEAGTLQPGRCAALEEAWFLAHTGHKVDTTRYPKQARYGQLVGLAALYMAAEEALMQTMNLLDLHCSVQPEVLTLVVRAFDTLIKPRPLEDMMLLPEVVFVRAMLEFTESQHIERVAVAHPACFRQLQQIGAAWTRVQASGVLQRRGLDLAYADLTSGVAECMRECEAVNVRQASRGLRSCGLASCGAKEAHVNHFKRCSACKTIVYCCKEHQLEDWPAHKAACKAARKAAAEEE